MKYNCAFLVLSCDNYSDLWTPFFHFFSQKWTDCKLDKFIVTNFKDSENKSFKSILVGEDVSWSDNLIKALAYLEKKYQYVFVTVEDVPILNKINNKKFNTLFESFTEENGDYMSLRGFPAHQQSINKLFGRIPDDGIYRANCVYSLWKIKTLQKMLKPGENAWEFEFNVKERSVGLNFFSTKKKYFRFIHLVNKGRYINYGIFLSKLQGYDFEYKYREKQDLFSELHFNLRVFFHKKILYSCLLPPYFRKKLIKVYNTYIR